MIRSAAHRISPCTPARPPSWRGAAVVVALTGTLFGSTAAAVSKGDAAPSCAAAGLEPGGLPRTGGLPGLLGVVVRPMPGIVPLHERVATRSGGKRSADHCDRRRQ